MKKINKPKLSTVLMAGSALAAGVGITLLTKTMVKYKEKKEEEKQLKSLEDEEINDLFE